MRKRTKRAQHRGLRRPARKADTRQQCRVPAGLKQILLKKDPELAGIPDSQLVQASYLLAQLRMADYDRELAKTPQERAEGD